MESHIEKGVIELYQKQVGIKEIVDKFSIGRTSLYRILEKYNIKTHPKGTFTKGRIPWNEGLTTKDTRVKLYVEKSHLSRLKNGSYKPNSGSFKKGIKPWWIVHNVPHPLKNPESRKKLSEAKTQAYKEGKIEKLFKNKNPSWCGGRIVSDKGYILICCPGHPNIKSRDNYVPEHRLIMEKHLDRYLTKEEVVHHINGIRDDNRIENLKLFVNNGEHMKYHAKLRRQKSLAQKVRI